MAGALSLIGHPWLWSFFGLSSVSAFIYYWLFGSKLERKTIRVKPTKVDLRHQSRILPGPERIRASVWCSTDTGSDEFLMTVDPSIENVYDQFLRGVKRSSNGDCLGTRSGPDGEYVYMSFQQVLDRVNNFASGLCSIGATPGQDTLVGIYAQNVPEWDIAMFALAAHSRIVVPLYDTLGPEAVSFIVDQAVLRHVICDTADRARKLIQAVKDHSSSNPIKHLIMTKRDQASDDLAVELSEEYGITLHYFADVEQRGSEEPVSLMPATPSDLFIICYTSGTTGTPKGVMLSHRAAVAEAACVEHFLMEYCGHDLYPGREDICMLSYLPMAHVFECMAHVVVLGLGYKIGYYSGDIKKIVGDMKACKPFVLPVVPRLLNRIYDQLQARMKKSTVFGILFKMAKAAKWAELEEGVFRWDTLWDKIIWNRIRGLMGGQTEIMITGSAPIAGEVLNMCRVALGCNITEGYGQTECCAGCTLTVPGDLTTGHVGSLFPSCQMKVVDVPELDYWAKDDKGEVCIRGPIVMEGYYKEPEKTAEAIDEDGWLHTGDVGIWLPNGTLKIFDRKKHIFKLAQGEYVAPEKIESVYMRSHVVAQVYVDGNSLERFLVAIVVPDEDELRRLAANHGLVSDAASVTFSELCRSEILTKATLDQMRAAGKENKLNSIEQVQAIYLHDDLFSVENGLLTPTLKSKRPQLRKRFGNIIDDIYAKANK